MENPQTKPVPASACRMRCGEWTLRDNGPNSKTMPVSMTARSGQPIEHWYWGKVIHDLAGMKLAKPRLPIDYCHEDTKVIGYLNHFDASSGDLVASGALIPYGENDIAAEVIYKAKEGIPYEASINFGGDGIKIEELAAGQVAQVNGRTFEGPGIIIREWPLRGVAVCPYGADMNTSTNFNAEKDRQIVITKLAVASVTAEEPMNIVKPATEAAKAVEVEPKELKAEAAPVAAVEAKVETPEPAAPAVVEADPKALAQPEVKPEEKPHARFVATFGDRGATWFLEGKTYTECAEIVLAERLAKITELQAQLASAPRGNPAVTFEPADKPVVKEIKDLIRIRK